MSATPLSVPQFVLPPLPELRCTAFFGRKIYYYDIGSGPTLVLVHGLGGDADQWAYCFDALFRHTSRTRIGFAGIWPL